MGKTACVRLRARQVQIDTFQEPKRRRDGGTGDGRGRRGGGYLDSSGRASRERPDDGWGTRFNNYHQTGKGGQVSWFLVRSRTNIWRALLEDDRQGREEPKRAQTHHRVDVGDVTRRYEENIPSGHPAATPLWCDGMVRPQQQQYTGHREKQEGQKARCAPKAGRRYYQRGFQGDCSSGIRCGTIHAADGAADGTDSARNGYPYTHRPEDRLPGRIETTTKAGGSTPRAIELGGGRTLGTRRVPGWRLTMGNTKGICVCPVGATPGVYN